MGLSNIGEPQIGNRAIIQLALAAGVGDVIADIVRFGTDKRTLLLDLAKVLEHTMLAMQGSTDHSVHPALDLVVVAEILLLMDPGDIWGAINTDVLDRLLDFLGDDPTSAVARVVDLPAAVAIGGPATVTASRDSGSPTQVNITFPESPEGWDSYEIYVNYRFVLHGNIVDNPPVAGVMHTAIILPTDGIVRSIRVLYSDTVLNTMGLFSDSVPIA